MVDRFSWPRVIKDVYGHVKSFYRCQLLQYIAPYQKNMKINLTGLLDVIQIDNSSRSLTSAGRSKYDLIALENLTGWKIERDT